MQMWLLQHVCVCKLHWSVELGADGKIWLDEFEQNSQLWSISVDFDEPVSYVSQRHF